MYFSTNSRYVLHRAPWMTPSAYILKGAEKLLSVKVPNDDPSKPALRVNIPKESSDGHSKLMHNSSLKNFGEPRSKSLVSRPRAPAFNANFKDGVLPKAESEVQLVQMQAEDFMLEADTQQVQAAQQNQSVETKTENEYQEGLRTPLHDAVAGEALAGGYNGSNQSITNAEPDPPVLEEAKAQFVEEAKPQFQEPDPRMLYIIVDSQDDTEKTQSKTVAETSNEENTTPVAEDDFNTSKTPHKILSSAAQRHSKLKPRYDNFLSKKAKSTPKVFKPESRPRKFEVQEVEDFATYVLHSRQVKDARKSFGVECVPEKEFTTRSGSVDSSDAPIKVRGRTSFKGLANEVVPVEELPDFVKVPEGKRKSRIRKSDSWGGCKAEKPKTLTTTKELLCVSAQQIKPSAKQESADSEYLHVPVDPEKAKSFDAFVKDDFGSVRSNSKTPEIRMPEPKQAVAATAEEVATAPPENQAEVPEPKPEYNLIKMENSSNDIQTPPTEYFSHRKDDAAHSEDTPEVSYSNWVTPKPFQRSETGPTKTPEGTPSRTNKRRYKKMADSEGSPEKLEAATQSSAKSEKTDSDGADFQPSGSFVSIGCEKVPSIPMKFSAAFPPLLCEALKIRGRILGFRREFLFSDKWTGRFDYNSVGSKSTPKNKVDLSENSILFPRAETDKFDCSSLFSNKEETGSKAPKSQEGENSPKISDNIANVANDNLIEPKGKTSVDSLAMMKKVKEIVEFDLENAIKIFKKVEHPAETSSVMMLDGDKWRVDTEALEMYIKIRNGELTTFDDLDTVRLKEEGSLGDERNNAKIQDIPQSVPKYLPPKEEGPYHLKLISHTNSVVSFCPQTDSFFLNKEALSQAMRRRADESFDDVIIQTLEGQLTQGSGNESFVIFDTKDGAGYQMQNGDSILVFDEETQTWKVDYSILEKREQQLRMEEELTKRSELILETFEKLEKNHISKIPRPDTKQKKIFDYSKEEWKSLPQEKKSKDKKLPFKESNAEEIRRNNSDLYENLFVGKKNETTMNNKKNDPSSDKGSKACSSKVMKAAESGSSKESGTQKDSETPKKDSPLPPEEPKEDKPCESSKEESYWESFLNMNILPKDIHELPTKRPPPPPPPPPPPVAPPKQKPPLGAPKTEDPKPSVPPVKIEDPKPLIPPSKIEDPKPRIPPKKIEEPKLRGFFIPFIGDKRIEDSKSKIPPEPPKVEDPKKKSEPTIGGDSKPDPAIKAPPKGSPKIEEPIKKPTDPTIGGNIKQDPTIKAPPKESTKIEDPKKKPPLTIGGILKQDIPVQAPPKESPKIEDPIKKPSDSTIGGIIKEDPTIKAPPKESPKVEDPKKKPPELPPTAGGVTSEPKSSAQPKESPKVEEPKQKPPEPPPVASSGPKSEPKVKAPAKESPAIEDSKKKPPELSPRAGGDSKKAPPASAAHPMVDDPKSMKPPPTIGALKPQKEKSAAEHYVSDNIVEMSRNTPKDAPAKFKTNKIETVKLKITTEKRMPSKVTEINLNKKCDEKGKESNTALKKQIPTEIKKPGVPLKKNEKCTVENKSFYKNFEKYKTPFSDPEYEEKSMKIKSDIESNPNLKKLDNWNKTLVLHDIGKPPENIESWLKDETDKMATLLLKVLQEAADGKPRKKPPPVKIKASDKPLAKGNPFDGPQKKLETTPENFLFRVRTVNLALESDKKFKPPEERKTKQTLKLEAPGQQEKAPERPYKVIDASKLFPKEVQPQSSATSVKVERSPICTDIQKTRLSPTALESIESPMSNAMAKDFTPQSTLPIEITDEVPGPEFLKKLSNTWKLFPIVGSQLTIFTLLRAFQLVNMRHSFISNMSQEKSRADAFSKLFTKYGPIVNVQGPLSGNVILIHRPEHFGSVFEQDSVTPIRSVFDSLEQCRRETDEKIISTNVSTDWSKPEWSDLKRGSNDFLITSSEKLLNPAELAGDFLVNSIRKTRNQQNHVSEDFMEEIKRWSLEGLCSVMFEKSFGFLERKSNNINWIMEPDKLYSTIQEATHYLSKCEKGFQTWRLMGTPSSSGLTQAYRSLSTILFKQLYQAELNLKNKSELIKERNPFISEDLTFLESMLLSDGLTMEEITCNLVDIMLIGTNFMSCALGFLLYHLAQNVKVQSKLLKELKKALPRKDSRLDNQSLNSLTYLQACLKESLRMHIPVPMFYRLLQTDILLSNYIIPKGTYVVMDYRVNCMKEQIFDDPEKFLPERWLGDEKWMKDVHPFDTFPLCHGPRADLAKKIVEMQLWTCAAKVVRNFGIEYHYGEIEGTNSLIAFPDKPLKLNFIERDN